MDERIIQLETISALQENTIRELNEEVFRQQQDISRLQARISRLEEKISELSEGDEIAGNERPPHY